MGLLKLSCCSFDLKTRCIIVAIKSAILSFILFIIMTVTSVELGSTTIEIWLLTMVEKDNDTANVSAKIRGLYVTSIILVFLFLAKCLMDLFLVYGVLMERAKFIKAYVVMWLAFTFLSSFIFSLNSYYYGEGTILSEGVFFAINIYLIVVTCCFYVNLRSTQEVVEEHPVE